MSIQPSIPFSLTPDGRVSIETDPNVQIGQRVNALVSTAPGDRVMNLNYGVALNAFVFEDIDDETEARLADVVKTALSIYEPGVVVRVVTPTWSADQTSVLGVNVDYQRTDAPNSPLVISKKINTAVLKVGGTVQEVING